ncbi:ankyrin [Knoellia sinensis KCTC 19936]|uniref:Ankyrin n=1 Tax=Knoellia sinensis KCTC 19936 TaxID=1385520 RepID=A0A0A0J0C0_9MICO|nr:ankyrin repeat domain-containing protein [Knoellia sinensis]KGN30880.1 ankyrin [Knoellia sinensis KCTC 19936]
MSLTPGDVERVLALALDLARAGETEQLAEFLDHGLPVDATSESGDSLLMLAAYHDRPDTVSMLLSRGADPDLRNARDQSIIAGALFKGADEAVRLLVAAGADLDAGTPTARQAAEMFGRGGLLEED